MHTYDIKHLNLTYASNLCFILKLSVNINWWMKLFMVSQKAKDCSISPKRWNYKKQLTEAQSQSHSSLCSAVSVLNPSNTGTQKHPSEGSTQLAMLFKWHILPPI